MKRTITVALLLLMPFAAIVTAHQGKGHKKDHQTSAKVEPVSHVSVNVVFAPADVVILRDHYAPRYRNLPPGLQKKVARGGELPPGWKKKFEPFPVAIEHRLVPLPVGYRRGVIDAHAVIFNTRTNVIVDAAVLF